MPIPVRCHACAASQRVPRRIAGHSFHCLCCGVVNCVPKQAAVISGKATRTKALPARRCLVALVRIRCPICHARIKVTVEVPAADAVPGVTVPSAADPATVVVRCCTCDTFLRAKTKYRLAVPKQVPGGSGQVEVLPPMRVKSRSSPAVPAAGAVAPPAPHQEPAAAPAACSTLSIARSTVGTDEQPALRPVERKDGGPRPAVPCPAPPVPLIDGDDDAGHDLFGLAAIGLGLAALVAYFASDALAPGLAAACLALAVGVAGYVRRRGRDLGAGLSLAGTGAAALALCCAGISLIGSIGLANDPLLRLGADQKPTPLAADEWADAGKEALQRGAARITVCGTALRREESRTGRAGGKAGPGKPRDLVVSLLVDHVGGGRSFRCTGWAGAGPGRDGQPPVRLTDDAGKAYRLLSSAETPELAGLATAGVTLKPGTCTSVMLVFAPPSPEARILRLELAGNAVGQVGPFRFAVMREKFDPAPGPGRGPFLDLRGGRR